MSPALRQPANSICVAMNPSSNHHEPIEANCIPCASETLREAVRQLHPEWVAPNGECPPCFEFEQSLSGLTYTHPQIADPTPKSPVTPQSN